MSLGKIALGLASVVLGVNHLRNGAKKLSEARNGTPLTGFSSLALIQSRPNRAKAFHTSGRSMVKTSGGRSVPMRMRSYNIRTLDDRIEHLKGLVDEGKRDPQVYAFVRSVTNKKCGSNWCVPEKDNLGEARAVFKATKQQVSPKLAAADFEDARRLFRKIRKNVRYTSDIAGVDTYQKPSHTLALHSGDCDDYSSLTCAELGALGIPCAFKVIRTKGANDWNHIYALAGFPRSNPTRWVPMDSSVNMPFGWEAPRRMVAASRVFRVT